MASVVGSWISFLTNWLSIQLKVDRKCDGSDSHLSNRHCTAQTKSCPNAVFANSSDPLGVLHCVLYCPMWNHLEQQFPQLRHFRLKLSCAVSSLQMWYGNTTVNNVPRWICHALSDAENNNVSGKQPWWYMPRRYTSRMIWNNLRCAAIKLQCFMPGQGSCWPKSWRSRSTPFN